jgi:uncharacterized protein (DUF433 family)
MRIKAHFQNSLEVLCTETSAMVPQTPETVIVDYGRGPAIAGTRITVYDIMDYYAAGWHRDQIADVFPRVSSSDVQAAIDYIEAHKEEVTAEYEKILDRHANYKYPDWVQKIVAEISGNAERRLQELRARRAQENGDANHHG